MGSSKFSNHFELVFVKYSPFVVSLLIVFYHTVRTQLDMEWFLVFMLTFHANCYTYEREVYMFCKVHRCFVNYVVANIIACTIEYYWIDPYMNAYWYAACMLGTIVTLALGLIYYIRKLEIKKY